MLLEANCGVEKAEDEDVVLNHVIHSSHPQLALTRIADPEQQRVAMGPMLKRAITERRADDALMLIERGANPNYLPAGRGRTLLENALSPRVDLDQVAAALVDAGADTIIRHGDEKTRYVLRNAVEHGSVSVATQILHMDPDQITRENLTELLLDGMHRSRTHSAPMLRILIDHGLEFDSDSNRAPSMMLQAVRRGDVDLARYLLQMSFDPNHLFVTTTLLGEAKKSSAANAAEMVALLKQNGALDDILAQVRGQRPEAPACRRDDSLQIPEFDSLVERVRATLTQNDSRHSMDDGERCELIVRHCRNHGMGFDDCLDSAPRCKSGDKDSVLCCDAAVVERYFDGRCAGLTVQEAVVWLDYFPTRYRVPRVLSAP